MSLYYRKNPRVVELLFAIYCSLFSLVSTYLPKCRKLPDMGQLIWWNVVSEESNNETYRHSQWGGMPHWQAGLPERVLVEDSAVPPFVWFYEIRYFRKHGIWRPGWWSQPLWREGGDSEWEPIFDCESEEEAMQWCEWHLDGTAEGRINAFWARHWAEKKRMWQEWRDLPMEERLARLRG